MAGIILNALKYMISFNKRNIISTLLFWNDLCNLDYMISFAYFYVREWGYLFGSGILSVLFGSKHKLITLCSGLRFFPFQI